MSVSYSHAPCRSHHYWICLKALFLIIASGWMFAFHSAQAFPLTSLSPQPSPTFDALNAAQYDFDGIVALGNCSGSIVRFEDSAQEDAAIVLTNGHCVALLDPGEVRVNEASSRDFTLLASDSQSKGKVRSKRLIYATMTGTDMALYELSITYAKLAQDFDVEPLTLANSVPRPGTPIQVVSGYWRRGYSCAIDRLVNELREGKWTMQQSIKYTDPDCNVIGGTSGSPIIETGTRTVIGVNNTGNEDGKSCQLNNPCEVDKEGKITYKKGWSYGQQTYLVYACRNSATGDLDLSLPECKLAKPRKAVAFE